MQRDTLIDVLAETSGKKGKDAYDFPEPEGATFFAGSDGALLTIEKVHHAEARQSFLVLVARDEVYYLPFETVAAVKVHRSERGGTGFLGR